MKYQNIMRVSNGLRAFFPATTANVQEIEPTHSVTVAAVDSGVASDRGRLLAQRNARHARRLAH